MYYKVMTSLHKLALRRSYRQVREYLPIRYQEETSSQICMQIRNLECYQHAKKIAFYYATNGEVNLDKLRNAAYNDLKSCYFPILDKKDKTLSFLSVTQDTVFIPNEYGILEPSRASTQLISIEELDLLLIPLVSFDKKGTRLGMGGGFYDRALDKVRQSFLLGVAYDFQRHDALPVNSWDIPLTAVITEQSLYSFK